MSARDTCPESVRADDALTRRALLAALPLAGGALALPAMVEGAEHDPLPDLVAEWRAVMQRWNDEMAQAEHETPESRHLFRREMELEDLIANTEPTSRPGAVAKLSWVLEDCERTDGLVCDLHAIALRRVRDALAAGLM